MFVEAREGPARCPVREQQHFPDAVFLKQQAESRPCTAEPAGGPGAGPARPPGG